MKRKKNAQLIKFLLIIEILEYILSKSSLKANGIYNGKCDYEFGRYIFNINATLTGNLSKSIFENFSFKIKNYNNNLKIICNFPEEKVHVKNKNILIICYINNMAYDNFSLSLEGTNDYLDLINFNEKILYVENIFCKKEITLILGDIKEKKCKQFGSLYYYNYKIEIMNKSIPKRLELYNFDLNPKGLNTKKYNIACNLLNINNNNYFDCSLFVYKKINNSFYYNSQYTYEKESNDYIIYIKNQNKNLYIYNNKCEYDNKEIKMNPLLNEIYIKNNKLKNLYNLSIDFENINKFIRENKTKANNLIINNKKFFINSKNRIINKIYNLDLRSIQEIGNESSSNESSSSEDYYDDSSWTESPDSTDPFYSEKLSCNKGFYSKKINNEKYCTKCLSTCKECESLNNCSSCQNGYYLKNNLCLSCFSLFEGCEQCNENKCSKCFNNDILQYELENDLCQKKEGQNNSNNKQINLKFERFDGFEQEDNKVYFKAHFLLLNDYLSNAELEIDIKIITKTDIRYLDEDQKTVNCSQYGNAFGYINAGGYLANFKCSFNFENDKELVSIEPITFTIKDNKNNPINIKNFNPGQIKVKEIGMTSLDEEYNNYIFNKMEISKVSDVKLDNKLTFNINGDFDQNIEDENEYIIDMKNDKNETINAQCHYNPQNEKILSCTIPKDNIEQEQILSFEEGNFPSNYNTKERLIISNLNNEKINVPKKKLSVGAIIGIVIAGIVIIVPFFIYLTKYLIEKKDINFGNRINNEDYEERNRHNRGAMDNSKEIIFNRNS